MPGGAVGKEPDRLGVADRVDVIAVGWRVHGWHPVDALAIDTQRLPARREQCDAGAISQQRIGELDAGVDDVLAVVQQQQQQQQAPLADCLDDRVDHGAARVRPYAQHVSHRGRDQIRVLQRGEIGEPHPVT